MAAEPALRSLRRPRPRLLTWLGRDRNWGDFLFRGFAAGWAASLVLVVAAFGIAMLVMAWPAIARFGLWFPLSRSWDPVHQHFGALAFVWGTLASSLLALCLAVPIALGVAIYLAELAPPWLRVPAGYLLEILAAVPSVIYGLWGVFVLAPWLRQTAEPGLAWALGWLPFFQGPPRGFDLLAGGTLLAIMILPTIASVCREVLSAVPNNLREGALALGATRWEMVWVAVLPYARSGIFGAILLGLGRALGETMAITMVMGNRPEISASLFAPAASLASVLANEFAEATGRLHHASLAYVGLVLFGTTVALNAAARVLVSRVARSGELTS